MDITALVVEANTEQRQRLAKLLTRRSITPSLTGHPRSGRDACADRSFALAIIDWPASDAQESVQLLGDLRRNQPDATAIVRATTVHDTAVASAIVRAHPRALIHHPDLGLELLGQRIDQLLGKHVDDLVLRDGGVVHTGTGDRFQHSLASRLMLAHPRGIVVDDHAGVTAVWRFRAWLAKRSSPARVVGDGTSRYRLAAGSDGPATSVDDRRRSNESAVAGR